MTFQLHDDVTERVKQADADRVRSAYFAQEDARRRLMLLYAFHLELAKVPELVSEPMIGQIRYQWWREAVAEIYETDAVRKHEITTPLRTLLLDYDVPRFWIDQLIDGRERDIDPRPFETLSEAKDYSANTSGVLMKIAVKILGADPHGTVEQAGTSWGLTGLARAYPYYHQSMLSAVSFDEICEAAKNQYDLAKRGMGGVKTDIFPAIAYTALIPPYLKRLTKVSFDPKTEAVTYTAFAKQSRLLIAALRGKV
ncbi:squalene/phytoene synthase family protein [Litorimonas haliclonae]|uniref:squalene/phytoene synthase family protein n=1 Tax=Litorimonas haliclonae TaxID=2081977 RepID=UPI0039EF0DFD